MLKSKQTFENHVQCQFAIVWWTCFPAPGTHHSASNMVEMITTLYITSANIHIYFFFSLQCTWTKMVFNINCTSRIIHIIKYNRELNIGILKCWNVEIMQMIYHNFCLIWPTSGEATQSCFCFWVFCGIQYVQSQKWHKSKVFILYVYYTSNAFVL